MNRNLLELLAAVFVTAFFVYLFGEARGYAGQSKVMPVAVTGLAVALSLTWGAQCCVALVKGGGAAETGPAPFDLRRLAIIATAVVIYALGIGTLGYFTSTIIMLPALSISLGYRNWLVAILVTLGFAAVLYAVFRLLLSVPLPAETLFGMVG
ncbi:MAG: tripartite tricarboxylate transporter TctB family protein [Pseudodonghicola sp.]|nr:tripartite tricarboxylate transporter TctB family protein [Pseudodonghicola sp.]